MAVTAALLSHRQRTFEGFSTGEGADKWEEGITKDEPSLMGQAGLSSQLLKRWQVQG